LDGEQPTREVEAQDSARRELSGVDMVRRGS
jgi:hypothetical protein